MRNITIIAIVAAAALVTTSAIIPYQIAALQGTQPLQTQDNEPVNAPKITTPASTPLTNVFAIPSNNIAMAKSEYNIAFTGAGGESTAEITFPDGFDVSNAKQIESTVSTNDGFVCCASIVPLPHSGQTLTVQLFGPGQGPGYRFVISDIRNGITLNNQVVVTTKDSNGNTIAGPTPSAVFQLKNISHGMININAVTTPKIANGAVTTEKIADNSVTLNKIAPSFMKVVLLKDDDAGHAAGWNPDGSNVLFIITDGDIKSNSIVYAQVAEADTICVSRIGTIDQPDGQMLISCVLGNNQVQDGHTLRYVVINPLS